MDHWGVIEKWSLPTDGYGDCEDYVLLKRKMLIDAGWPREALLITVVRDKKGEGHAVLTVKSDKGEFVLDNQNEDVVAWTETGYRFVKRQSQSDPNVWVSLGDSRPAVATASVTAIDNNKDLRETRPGHFPTPPRPRPDRGGQPPPRLAAPFFRRRDAGFIALLGSQDAVPGIADDRQHSLSSYAPLLSTHREGGAVRTFLMQIKGNGR